MLFSLCTLVGAQDPKPPAPPSTPTQPPPPAVPAVDPAAVLAEVQQQFQAEGIVFDTKAMTVAVPAVVNHPQDPIEYLLIHKKGKRHEAVFVTKAKPSVLNAALLLLGLQRGKNASVTEKNPPPTLEEIERGADPVVVTPPQGEPFWMTVRWQTPEGKAVEHCVEDLLLDLSTQQPVADCRWVYLGGRMAQIYRNEPEVYVADLEGNLISICYLMPDNHLGTMVHQDARDDQNWWTTTLLPPPDTEVQFVFHRREPELHQQRAAKAKAKAAEAKPADGKAGDKGQSGGK
jgi:hypothetical protein